MTSANVNFLFILFAIFINICTVFYIQDKTKEIENFTRVEKTIKNSKFKTEVYIICLNLFLLIAATAA